MLWHWVVYPGVFLALSPFGLPVTALIHPRRANYSDIARYNVISDTHMQIPIRAMHKPDPVLHHLRSRYYEGPPPMSGQVLYQNISTIESSTYWVPVIVGGQQVNLIIDTGSSDTWVIADSYTCDRYIKRNGTRDPRRPDIGYNCGFGPGFDPDQSDTFQVRNPSNKSFAVQYVDTSGAFGYVGEDILSIAGMDINQTIGVANLANWKGDHVTGGVLGLSYPGSTPSGEGHKPYDWVRNRTRNGSPEETRPKFDCHDTYPSLIENVAAQGYDPVFSIALSKSKYHLYQQGLVQNDVYNDSWVDGGLMTFGGIPNLKGLGLPFAKAKMNPWMDEETSCASNVSRIGYGLEVDGIADGSDMLSTGKFTTRLDTGCSMVLWPRAVARKILERVHPPPPLETPWRIACDAEFPEIKIVIGGVAIPFDRKLMIRQTLEPEYNWEGKAMCSTNFMMNIFGDDLILGAPFLQGVLAVYDIGHKEIRIAQRFEE
ncbi:hypothetical protein DRE_04043 [Drechslerella stenobrocha 248]|uniref:Peptidase A1 domain-containing protein n=1 Tax=Drechslerella stenobrocha 248 TaxID=1043628 RepID=W7I3L6_9PEZI|nr:hypothetical protein DRE_04043 [Drechslerella stenobrocha 248]